MPSRRSYCQKWFSRYIQVPYNFRILLTLVEVTEDLVRYMGYAMSGGNNFLVDDPNWAIDFAPNGEYF